MLVEVPLNLAFCLLHIAYISVKKLGSIEEAG
jgi:hypothetical protein